MTYKNIVPFPRSYDAEQLEGFAAFFRLMGNPSAEVLPFPLLGQFSVNDQAPEPGEVT